MKYKRSILRGYDKVTEKLVADAIHMPIPPKKSKNVKRKHMRGVRK